MDDIKGKIWRVPALAKWRNPPSCETWSDHMSRIKMKEHMTRDAWNHEGEVVAATTDFVEKKTKQCLRALGLGLGPGVWHVMVKSAWPYSIVKTQNIV